jgi:TRAP-type C4-dicarboxylate transport system substrate-binding protein
MRSKCSTLAAAAMAASLAACVPPLHAETAPIVIKLASATLNDGQHEWMKLFAEAIERKAGGRIKTELYPASQLGSIPRMIEGTQLGSIQIFNAPPEFFVGVDPRFELLSAPALVDSEQHAIMLASDPEFARAFLAVGADKGLIGVSLFIGGPVAFAMRAPFRKLADLKGRKIRVLASPFQTEQVARLGGTGVPLSLGDVLPALQQGTIDGSLGQVGLFTALRYYDTARYMNETGHAFVFVIAVVSRRWFDTLPQDLQGMVVETAQETGIKVNRWEVDFLTRQRAAWVEHGGELDELSPTEKIELTAKIADVGDNIAKTRPGLRPLWDVLRSAAKHR